MLILLVLITVFFFTLGRFLGTQFRLPKGVFAVLGSMSGFITIIILFTSLPQTLMSLSGQSVSELEKLLVPLAYMSWATASAQFGIFIGKFENGY